MISVTPYESIGNLRFGMTEIEVRDSLGDPLSVSKDRRGSTVLRYEDQLVTIASEGVVEVGFLPEAPVTVSGISPFQDPNAFEKLCELDGDPKEVLGFIVMLNLGITMTGFHDRDEAQKAITAFSRGRWDVLQSDMRHFSAA